MPKVEPQRLSVAARQAV
ncbi:hypothetical protein D031_3810A, partial [Vibrio parahaemolyticus VP-48]